MVGISDGRVRIVGFRGIRLLSVARFPVTSHNTHNSASGEPAGMISEEIDEVVREISETPAECQAYFVAGPD